MHYDVEVAMGKIFVNVARSIGVGNQYRIVGSYGYAGIEDGVVEVIGLILPEDIDNHTDLYADYKEQIKVNIDAEMQAYEDGSVGDYEQAYRELIEQPWVVYQYPYGTDHNDYLLPLDMFISHTCTAL